MRITTVFNRQHIGFMFKKHWRVQGSRTPSETNAEQILLSKGISAVDVKDWVHKLTKPEFVRIDLPEPLNKRDPEGENHPNWNQKTCHIYRDDNVLLEGLSQAQVLTKTITFDELPEKLEESLQKLKIPSNIERSMQQSVLVSHLLDAQQEKTAKVKIPEKPAYTLPRNYGITDSRKNLLLATRLINHCERFAGRSVTSTRKIINDAYFVTPFEKDGDLIQMEIQAETFISSKKPLSSQKVNFKSEGVELPNLFPLKHTVSMTQTNIYEKKNIYPINKSSESCHPHTIMVHFSHLDVHNLFGTPVTEIQFESRAMLKAFTVAASQAQSLYGPSVRNLSKPIVVQVVQMNGSKLQFGVFQLNTLNLDGSEGIKNFWFRKPAMELYQECLYKVGKPSLTGYNRDVLKHMSVFYNNS